MGTAYKGVGATNVAATIPTLMEEGQQGGAIHTMFDVYTLTADLAAGDTIIMGAPIPEGSRLVDCRIAVPTTGLGGSCTINVGWQKSTDLNPTGSETLNAADATGFFSALPVSAVTYARAFGSTYQGDFYGTVLTSSVQCVIAENAVSSGATGLKIYMEVDYIQGF